MRSSPLLVLLLLAACNRPSAPSPSAAPSASSAAVLPAQPPDDDPLRPLMEPMAVGVQAHDATLAHAGYHELLAPLDDILRARFAGATDEQIRLQVVPLLGASRAVLAYAAPDAKGRPLLMAFDEQRSLGWLKERPIHDLDPRIARLALAPGPEGDLLLVFHDPPTGSLAARRWDKGGGLLADFRIGEAERLDALSAVYWPGRGWLVAYSSGGAVRAQFLTDRGKLPWGLGGKTLAATGAQPGPLRLLLDTEVSALLFWPALGAAADRRFMVARVDFEGTPLWRAPVDLGPAGSELRAPEAERAGVALVRATLPGPSGHYSVEITAEGQVRVP